MDQGSSYEYDVVLSFAGEDRDYVESVANELHRRHISVFYDHNEQSILWGKDLQPYVALSLANFNSMRAQVFLG